ncbi:nitrogenase component 1 [Clostridium pasteurianum]|uniref:Nitrogenase molybdenum-iron protein, alpha and beta chains n=1 Tax=Clostridium pasteurianum BC1 TaxID=86416 RepID=R4KG98_CLOPA|nr:nitrogenase component 1 [Clostridium pasteurianum]AGK99524.1 nitrogenase molybdenum-iron protein, alpha and beta chains [Clostridium pasteurianum BC1]
MSYFDNKVAPKREHRLNFVGSAFGGSTCELLGCAKEGCLKNKKRSFSQATACQLGLVLGMALTMPDTIFIIHGPVGCGSQIHSSDFQVRSGTKARGGVPKPLIWLSTNLNEKDVINGGEAKLRETILEADKRYKPIAIIVMNTCSPSMIGDDIDEVVRSTQETVNAKIMPMHCEGIKSQVVANAYDTYYHGVGRNLDLSPNLLDNTKGNSGKFQLEEINYKKSKIVNLFNFGSLTYPDEVETIRLLETLGLKVRVFPNFAHPNDFRKLSEAALNISLCNVHDDYFLTFLKERFGTPYFIHNMPVGIKNTSEWFIEVAKQLNLEEKAKEVIAAEEQEVFSAIEPFRKVLKGKRVLITGGIIRVVSDAMLLDELGCEVIAVRAHHYDSLSTELYTKFNEKFPSVDVSVAPNQAFELINIINRDKPDICLTHAGAGVWVSKLGVPSLPLFGGSFNYFGYKGAFEVARRMTRLLKNSSFQHRLSENTSLPYKKEWYDKNPFAYIKD